MGILTNKIQAHFERKKAFKKASFVLQNGRYSIAGNRFCLSNSNGKKSGRYIRIETKDKNKHLLNEGMFVVTPYKFIFLSDNIVFSFIRGKQRFVTIKNNINLYLSRIPYRTMNCFFVCNKELIVSNFVHGTQFDDDKHLWLFIDYYLKSIKRNFISIKSMIMHIETKNIMFYPQHGDCHAKNIFWSNNLPTLIDLDDIDNYPIFYDIFYFAIASKHENAFVFFRSKDFETKLKDFCSLNGLDIEGDVIDLYLGAYVYYWVNKMKRKMKYHEIHFYLRWFEKADLSSYPTVSNAMKEYSNNLKKMRIKK